MSNPAERLSADVSRIFSSFRIGMMHSESLTDSSSALAFPCLYQALSQVAKAEKSGLYPSGFLPFVSGSIMQLRTVQML